MMADEENQKGTEQKARVPLKAGKSVIPRCIEDEMKESYIDYSMSVIVGRALPDVRDGLKPVHRRILYAMHELGLQHNKPYRKSARVVGDCLGKYHPHGDMAVYDAMVRMVQNFSLRYPLVDGQGNFGSVDGDAPAAQRYTEVRMARIAEEMLEDIDKETVDFTPNFDDSLEEPTVLPSKIPNLLINGSSGIAVGMATNMPPHNLSEVVDGVIATIDNPSVTSQELMQYVKGPDFPTGATICGSGGIIQAYTTGRGSIRVRAKAEIIDEKKKKRIIVTELPYQVNKASLIEGIADLVRDKKIEGISDIRDESDRKGMRIVIEIKSGAQPDVVLNQLYKHTAMESTFGIINLALVDKKPVTLGLKELITNFIDHRKDVITRRSKFELNKSESQAHILEGLRIALGKIDDVVKIIRASKTPEDAKTGLRERFNLSEKQSQAILEMRLQRLTNLERTKIEEEYQGLLKYIAWLKDVLAHEEKILGIIKEELLDMKKKYGDERRTVIEAHVGDIEDEDLIAEEDMVVSITNQGYIKRLPVSTYHAQKRGGRGVIGMETKEEDFVESLFVASTHDYVLFFTDKGKVYWLKVYQLPIEGRYARGKAIVNLLNLEEGEKISASIKVSEFKEGMYLVAATKKGLIKKTKLSAYSRPRRGGIIAMNLREGDELVGVSLTNGGDELLLSTKNGKSIRFKEKDARPVGRASMGVRGIKLKGGDGVVGMVVVDPNCSLLTVTENGYGKRTDFSRYPVQRRGGQGVIDIKTTERNGKVVSIRTIDEDDEIMSVTSDGIVIRTPVKGISEIARNTQGVRIMKLNGKNKVVSVARIISEEEEEGIEAAIPAEKPEAAVEKPKSTRLEKALEAIKKVEKGEGPFLEKKGDFLEPAFKEVEAKPKVAPSERETRENIVKRLEEVIHLRKPGMGPPPKPKGKKGGDEKDVKIDYI
jgi:DNA gyrase subunit A